LIKFYLFTYKKTNLVALEDGTIRKINKMPVIAVAVFSTVVFFFGANFSNFASQKLGINYIEGRPSWSATFNVASDVLKEKSLLGSGPSTFFYDWRQFKPKDFNTTPFWSVDFSYGVGYLPTMIATTGILGLIAWLIVILSSVKVSLRLLKVDHESTHEWNNVRQAVAFLNLFALVYLITYVPNYSMIVLFFVVYAISVALLVASGGVVMKKIDLIVSFPKLSKFSSIFSIILVVASIVFAYEFGRIMVASVLSNQAVSALSKGQFIEANQLAFKAVKVKNLPLYNSILSQVDFLTLRALGAGEKSLESLTEENIKALLGEAVSAALAAESLDPLNTNYTIATGNILAGLGALGAKDGFESALVKFDEASKKTPLDPLPSFLKAQVYLSQKDIKKTKEALLESVSLKPNYTESYVTLAQIALLEKDVAKAREYLDLSIASDPQNINLRYERGVDRYSLSNFDGAMEDFNAVLGLNNSVANARYFKALSLYRLGNKEEALNELRIVQQTNQDNEELKKTIQMIESSSENTSNDQSEEKVEEQDEN
jgi:tetratricopeptide (TPR) repeat protein